MLVCATLLLAQGASALLTAPTNKQTLHARNRGSCATATETVGQESTIYAQESEARHACQQVVPDVYAAIFRRNDDVIVTLHAPSTKFYNLVNCEIDLMRTDAQRPSCCTPGVTTQQTSVQ